MKKIFASSALMFLLPLAVTNIYAGMYAKGYFQWAKGEFEIPEEIKKVTSPSELNPFLESKKEFTRMAAVRRLGEIEGPNAVAALAQRFEQEPERLGTDGLPLVKFEIIRTLGRIGTEQAKSTLLGMLGDYWKRVPRPGDKGGITPDRDFEVVTPILLETLYKWTSDKEVVDAAKAIALSPDIKKYGFIFGGPEGIGQRAWEVYLKGQMIRKGIIEEKDSAEYLFDFVDDIMKKGLDSVELGPLKGAAAGAILRRHSEATLSSMISEYKIQFKNEPRDPKGFFTERHNILRRRIGVLKKILKDRQEEERKKAERQEEKPAKNPRANSTPR